MRMHEENLLQLLLLYRLVHFHSSHTQAELGNIEFMESFKCQKTHFGKSREKSNGSLFYNI